MFCSPLPQQIKQEISNAAARVIQIVWRRHRTVGTLDKELSVPFLQAVTEFRKIRRARNSLRARMTMDPTTNFNNHNHNNHINNIVNNASFASLEKRIESIESTLHDIVNKLELIAEKR
jgi:hypothetical protein